MKPGLEAFAADALDFAEVQALLERHVRTPLGRRAVRELSPLPDPEARAALRRAAEALPLARSGEIPNLAGIGDVVAALDAARAGGRALEDEDFAGLRDHLEAQERVVQWLRGRARELPACADLARGMPDLSPLRERLEASLDDQGVVRDEASPLLARVRREMGELSKRIDGIVRAIVARPAVKAALADSSPRRRGGRVVLSVRTGSAGKVPGIVHDRSNTGETLFVEPREVVLPSNQLAELRSDERREIDRILVELTRAVLDERARIEEGCRRLAALELAFVAAAFAAETRGGVPLLPDDPSAARGLLLRSARHPLLLEEVRQGRLREVVAIDLRLSGDFDVLVITGPNTGGKTLALKTAGIAALLVRCGMPVPCAEGSTVPLYDGIVADIGDEQEIRQSLSTFSSHLTRIRAGIARATRETLVLLDELGAGTDPDEGAALSEAVLELFLERGSPTLATTHLGKLKEFAFRHARAENACVEFDPETLAPCYRILVGTPGESGALAVARRIGIPETVVARAEERLERRDAEIQELLAEVRDARVHAERVRSETEERLEGVAKARREIDETREALARRGEMLEAEAQRGIEERVREARRRLASARALLDQLPPVQRAAIESALSEIDAELSGAALSERRAQFLAGLKKGSWVYLPRYDQRVHLLQVHRAAREVTVQVGRMRMRVSFDELESRESRSGRTDPGPIA